MAKVLVVDDEADMRLALRTVLEQGGHSVEEAGDGPAALERVARGGLDLVLLDIRLPGMDGRQILRRIREQTADLPVIMVSGYGSVDSAVEVMQLGASHYLAKPFSNKELSDTIARVLDPQLAQEGALRRRLSQKVSALGAESPPRAAQASSLPVSALAMGLAAAVLLGGLRWAWRSESGGSTTIPYLHPTAICWVGDTLWSADWFTQTIYEQRLKGSKLELVRSVRLPETHVTGLTVVGDRLYLTDSWKKVFEKRRIDATLSLVESSPSPGSKPSGLFWDGRYLWSSDSATGRFYQHDVDGSLSVLASYKSPGKTPAGMYKDAQYFWSADADTRMLYQHRLDNELRVVARYSLPALDEGTQALSCFTFKDGLLWLGRDGRAKLLRSELKAFRKLSAS